jgi:hypothetical protein
MRAVLPYLVRMLKTVIIALVGFLGVPLALHVLFVLTQ